MSHMVFEGIPYGFDSAVAVLTMRRPCRRPHDEPIDDSFAAGAFRTSYMVSFELVFVALFRAGAKSSVLGTCVRVMSALIWLLHNDKCCGPKALLP